MPKRKLSEPSRVSKRRKNAKTPQPEVKQPRLQRAQGLVDESEHSLRGEYDYENSPQATELAYKQLLKTYKLLRQENNHLKTMNDRLTTENDVLGQHADESNAMTAFTMRLLSRHEDLFTKVLVPRMTTMSEVELNCTTRAAVSLQEWAQRLKEFRQGCRSRQAELRLTKALRTL